MEDSKTSQIVSTIRTKFPFLSESEISDFLRSHPWLETELDISILLSYLVEYSEGLKEHYTNLSEKLRNIQKEGIQKKEEPKKEEEVEEEKEVLQPEVSILPPSEDTILMSLISKFDEMRSFFLEINETNETSKHFSFLYNVLWRIQQFPQNPNFRQISINPSDYILSSYLLEIFEALGFVRLELDSNPTLIYTDDKYLFFKSTLDFIEAEYCPQVKQNPPSESTPQMDRANQMAQIYENRLFNKPQQKPLSSNSFSRNVGNPLTNNTVTEQLKEYRERMRMKTFENARFTGQNVMTLEKLQRREEMVNNAPPMLNNQFQSKTVTMRDIENKRVEEEKVAFGHKALQLTNEFRKSQNLAPLVWNQELCNIGMKHSKDMAEGKVPFGHQGFQNRVNSIRFSQSATYENVAYCYNMGDTPKV